LTKWSWLYSSFIKAWQISKQIILGKLNIDEGKSICAYNLPQNWNKASKWSDLLCFCLSIIICLVSIPASLMLSKMVSKCLSLGFTVFGVEAGRKKTGEIWFWFDLSLSYSSYPVVTKFLRVLWHEKYIHT
jgi:hypothetical protein